MNAGPVFPRHRSLLLGGLCCGAALSASAWHLWPEALANARAMQPMAQVRAWQAPGAPAPAPAAWLQTRAALDRALQASPQNADLQEAMAYLYLRAALGPGQGALLQQAYLQQALWHLERATQWRPMVPSAWASQAMAWDRLALLAPDAQVARQRQAAMWVAFDRAMAHGRRDPGVQRQLVTVALAHWPQLEASRAAAVRTLYAQATPGQQRALSALTRGQPQALAWLQTEGTDDR